MYIDLHCRKCGAELEDWNIGNNAIRYCPCCGRKLLQKQNDELWRKCTDEEISDMVEGHVLDILENYDDLDAGDMGYTAWEGENANSVVFCSNYTADQFAMRHSPWMDDALEAACDQYGDGDHYAKMKADCNDRFLVVAFILATEHYLYQQLEIDNDEGKLTAKRKKEIRALIKETPYDGEF
ncbi:hypothetical protein FACS1894109_11040 [Spirochaetia bacterium]|nr:hypothetical protein FACS1894109_11040 [Spirochaetia bacterium]